MGWTVDQALALAPDPASAKAAQGLAAPHKWLALGVNAHAAWGECQGSAKVPYQAQVDFSGPAFHCSCPSHKFPCKHGLALLLLLANQPALFTQSQPPPWVSDWLSNRVLRAQQTAARRAPQSKAAAEPAAQVKRIDQREAKIAAGLAELDRWLADLMRRGLASAPEQPAKFWDGIAARMVDAQAPGLARRLRQVPALLHAGAGWQERLAEHLGKLHLLVEAYRRLESLSSGTQADVRALIGWTINQDDVLALPGVMDDWLILGRSLEEEEGARALRTQRTWLWSTSRRQAAVVLDFAAPGQSLNTSLTPGVCLKAELAYYPGAYPLRALIKQRFDAQPLTALPGYPDLGAAAEAYAQAVACNPWLEPWPVALQAVWPQEENGQWWVRDEAQRAWPLSPRFGAAWPLLALSGGSPLALFGEWDGRALLPLSVWAEGRFVTLNP